jgi:hypothetical protein
MFSVIRRSWLLPGLALTLAACAPRPFADKPVAVPMTVAFDLPRAEVADAFRRYATEAGMVVDASGDDSVVVARGRNAAGSLMASLGQDAAGRDGGPGVGRRYAVQLRAEGAAGSGGGGGACSGISGRAAG